MTLVNAIRPSCSPRTERNGIAARPSFPGKIKNGGEKWRREEGKGRKGCSEEREKSNTGFSRGRSKSDGGEIGEETRETDRAYRGILWLGWKSVDTAES